MKQDSGVVTFLGTMGKRLPRHRPPWGGTKQPITVGVVTFSHQQTRKYRETHAAAQPLSSFPTPFTQSGIMAHGTVSPTFRVSSSPVEMPSQTHSEWSPVGGSKCSRVGSEDGRAITASMEHRGKGRLSLDHRRKRCIQACSVCSGRC